MFQNKAYDIYITLHFVFSNFIPSLPLICYIPSYTFYLIYIMKVETLFYSPLYP